jgi:hypothetical protein
VDSQIVDGGTQRRLINSPITEGLSQNKSPADPEDSTYNRKKDKTER